MKRLPLYITLLIVVQLVGAQAMAQDHNTSSHSFSIVIPEVAILDIESSSSPSISLQAKAPTQAGDALTFGQSNRDLWINYSSIVGAATRTSRKVTAQIASGTMPDGVSINLVATTSTGAGGGKLGVPVSGGILLNTTAQDLIVGIGSSYTGNGPGNGHQLIYTFQSSSPDAYQRLRFDQSTTVGVLYTITDY
ncbi:hypothetical protein [Telluribacter sp. SYSU D00476]|uniref:hypothetical protein n=1 Tax=Telluribacter sp. SYSU D00476 TaxID=2811430 RepID=UPI001FF2F7E0|nr:hypothetical protein [Telluribacter sp. SYSU D00476]